MVDIQLDKNSAEDVSLIMELKKMGVSDDVIQMGYNNTLKQRDYCSFFYNRFMKTE